MSGAWSGGLNLGQGRSSVSIRVPKMSLFTACVYFTITACQVCQSSRMSDGIGAVLQQAGLGDHASSLHAAGLSLGHAEDLLEQGRPALLMALKSAGVNSLSARQNVANALGKFFRNRGAPSEAPSKNALGPAPPGSATVIVRCAGALGGDSCPLNGVLRQSTVHTAAASVQALYEELRQQRGYAMEFSNVRVSLNLSLIHI